MAVNYIVTNSKFNPFSYAELIQPVQLANQAHQELENKYSELATGANMLEGMLNEQTDYDVYKTYKEYINDVENQAELLSKEGLNPLSRQNMLKLRQRYSSDIIPIEQAYKRRQELVDEQRKRLSQDNTLMFDKDASALRLGDLIKNPQLTYQSYSGANLMNQVGSAAKNLAKEMRENPRRWRDILGNQYYETIMQRGYSPEEIIQVLQNDPNASPILENIVEDAIKSTNIAGWGDKDLLERAYKYARQGLWNAVGDTQYQIQPNRGYISPENRKNNKDDKRLYYRTSAVSSVDETKKTSQMNADLQILKEIIANPSLLEQKDTREVMDPSMINPDPMTNYWINAGLGPTRQETYYPYVDKLEEMIKKYGDINYTITDGKLSGNLKDIAQQIENDIKSSAVREFTYIPNITQNDLIVDVLRKNSLSRYRRSNNSGLSELEDGVIGNEIDTEDLDKYFTPDANIEFDPDLGFIITSLDNKGKVRSAVIDTELLDDSNRTVKKFQENIKIALDNGEPEVATLFINGYDDENGIHHPGLMEFIYNRFNTLEKRQSNTSSK